MEINGHDVGINVPMKYSKSYTYDGDNLWIYFSYPKMAGIDKNNILPEDGVALLIRPSRANGGASVSDIHLSRLQSMLSKPSSLPHSRFLGSRNSYDVYEEVSAGKKSGELVYFYSIGSAELLCFEDFGDKINANKRYLNLFEVKYIFPKSLRQDQLKIDFEINKLIKSIIVK